MAEIFQEKVRKMNPSQDDVIKVIQLSLGNLTDGLKYERKLVQFRVDRWGELIVLNNSYRWGECMVIRPTPTPSKSELPYSSPYRLDSGWKDKVFYILKPSDDADKIGQFFDLVHSRLQMSIELMKNHFIQKVTEAVFTETLENIVEEVD